MTFAKPLRLLLGTAASFCISTAASAAIYTYEIDGSWATADDCSITAAEVTAAFNQRAQVLSSLCEASESGFKLQVAYAASARIETISTLTKYLLEPETYGGYPSKEDCLANLAGERSLFQSNTGLQPFVAICFKEGGGSIAHDHYDWNLRIEAMGPVSAGARLPNELALNMVGYFLTPEATIRQAISAALAARDLRPAFVQAHHANSVANLIKIRAYSQAELDLNKTTFATFTDGQSCFQEADRLNKSAYANEAFYLTAFCMSLTPVSILTETQTPANLRVVYLADLGSGLAYKDLPQPLPGSFETFAQCDAQRPSIIGNLEQALGKTVRASFCGNLPSEDDEGIQKFFVHVIE